jgi:phosphatidate cytidylyltransferase
MNTNLSKRIFTSLALLIILSIGLFLNKFIWLILLFVATIICLIELNIIIKKIFKNKKILIYLINLIILIFFLVFIFSSFKMHSSPPTLLILILSICIFSDIGGFVIGKSIGGRKLTKISPNKTISGSIGSFVFSLLPLTIFTLILEIEIRFSLEIDSILFLIFLSLFLSLVCQLGDLVISLLKRKANLKDTGSILPGHGGLLDRIDGVIFVLPVAYILFDIANLL